jgi:hypothetical protein
MFFARRPDGLDSHGLIETLSLCCYAPAAEAHIDEMLYLGNLCTGSASAA